MRIRRTAEFGGECDRCVGKRLVDLPTIDGRPVAYVCDPHFEDLAVRQALFEAEHHE